MTGNTENESKFKRWFKRVGVAGFLFFLAKGMVWLWIFYKAGSCAVGDS